MYHYHSKSKTGMRESNEDEHGTIINANGSDSQLFPRNFYGVYDGHGGSAVSKFIRPKLEKYFTNKQCDIELSDSDQCDNIIYTIYEFLNQKVEKHTSSMHCGSTASIAIQYSKDDVFNQLKVINLGDSRIVLCNKYNIAVPLTKDHKPNEREERIRIERMKGTIEKDLHNIYRVKGLSVSRAFGDFDCKPEVSNIPEIFNYELNTCNGKVCDKFLVLACDGLWDVMSSQEVVDFILDKMSHITNIETCDNSGRNNIALMLGTHAIKEKKSEDNVSIVIIYF